MRIDSIRTANSLRLFAAFLLFAPVLAAQPRLVEFKSRPGTFRLAAPGHTATIFLSPEDTPALGTVVEAFADDVAHVTGNRPSIVSSLTGLSNADVVFVGTVVHLPRLPHLDTAAITGHWESALTTTIDHPLPGIAHALVVAGSDRRGAAFALFTLSRQMGVSPWYWWADVPVAHHASIYIYAMNVVQPSPSVQYRGIFLNDEDWGLRPWASHKMDPKLHAIGPNTYSRIFELLLRLHANSLWPAMHPGTLPFNAVPENAVLADKWGIVMGASHSEALLRNNVGEWSEAAPPKGDGPWNYQLNRDAMVHYWDQRLQANGRYENFYTVGLRGVHDTGLEAIGDDQVKARLVEQAIGDQRALLAKDVNADLAKVPQVIWLYKESLQLFRAGMKVPPDVTLGWTDDNYGYIRQLPTVAEQKRPGGSGLYYHVSYWGFPHDYLWLCSTPPALMREELTKAFDHGVRRYWVLNVGDLKPAESDIDYFLQLAWDEPTVSRESQHAFLASWFAEQLPSVDSQQLATLCDGYYHLNFIRKPEFMGFNGYNDGVNRTAFNPLAFGDQNAMRSVAWRELNDKAETLGRTLPAAAQPSYFELVAYPIEAAAAMNHKFLSTDRTYLDAHDQNPTALAADTAKARAAYDRIQSLTVRYNALEGGKWQGMMSAAPRERHVFEMPATATMADAAEPLPVGWGKGDPNATISINAASFNRKVDGTLARWTVLPELGISSGGSVTYGDPGLLANQPTVRLAPQPSLDYDFTTTLAGAATVTLHVLPTFPLDSDHAQRFAVSLDGAAASILDTGSTGEWHEDSAPVWAANVLRNSAVLTIPVAHLTAGRHTLHLVYIDPGVTFEHIVITLPHAAPAYPVPGKTRTSS
jgi:hypothetical protein